MFQKRIPTIICAFALAGSFIGVAAASETGRYGGNDGMSINKEWHTGWNVQGDYLEATASNRADSPAYQKRVYARSGVDGSYSEWVPSGRTSVTHKDLGPYHTDLYEARFYWDYD